MIPNYEKIMLPFLKAVSDGLVYKFGDLVDKLSDHFGLNESERNELLPSGRQPIINNRVGWTRFYLIKAGLIRSELRGYIQISEEGKTFLSKNPQDLNTKLLDQFEEYRKFKAESEQSKSQDKHLRIETDEDVSEFY